MSTMHNPSILLVTQSETDLAFLSKVCSKNDWSIASVADATLAMHQLSHHDFTVVIIDSDLGDINGLQLLEWIITQVVRPEVVLLSQASSTEVVVKAIKHGAFDYLEKPLVSVNKVTHLIRQAIEKYKLIHPSYENGENFPGYQGIVGTSPKMRAVFDLIRSVSASDTNVLITGESGTGKELVAKAIHQTSLRKDKPFVVINCAAMPETLLESELFGYIRGAFTGAATDKEGLFEIAHEGCVFLDEIADIPPSMQVKLLRVIQEGEVRRIGDTLSKNIDVRIMAATNKNLASEISNGGFREDLFYRLNVIAINLPSLKDRSDDIPILTQSLLQKYTKQLGKPGVKIAFDALSALQNYSWPGNVRELENVIERAIVLSDGDTITAKNLPSKILSAIFYNSVKQEPDLAELNYKEAKKRALNIFNRSYIIGILEKTGWNITAASEQAGMDRSNFKKIIKKYSVEMKKE
ncbi:MAG: hypothetical protein A3G32_00740 [Deltaproteobacteria bacterium RIFCSPLOWO2_12_FULL_40_28]|nr:MAG: hypothetical protein A3C45_09625 [Deltaproteobacteria bacterium RIFCSPHIGHO2_02_FULL_40_28]OGQ19867.1 MAG: hypothetical protein A3E27_06575 [Deltaproteobacteria bacterium RIFCSPHIGHO2_12_FULL_40_32]OGQ39626.1 MAG: hypothetical protein A3I69_06005 [Deltaproteobacteria bacterium RIFCSPLOWO2_02_FULL_40_36]OGQ52882.1 MAG: hypothetical protein A3G32_00740 [Deltaproteobacteria bacterium RIFCSPLOWO2_12_FULL_40_28]